MNITINEEFGLDDIQDFQALTFYIPEIINDNHKSHQNRLEVYDYTCTKAAIYRNTSQRALWDNFTQGSILWLKLAILAIETTKQED